MEKNFKIMKTFEIPNAKNSKINSSETIEREGFSSEVDNSFERLFYNAINVFAYSKFYEVSADSQEYRSIKYVDLVKSLYENFVEKKGFFSGKHEMETYKKIILIIDEFCAEKFKKFMDSLGSSKERLLIGKNISDFIDDNDRNIEAVSDECRKKSENKYIEYVMKDLQEENPQKFKELIDFEINKIELKNIRDKIRFVVGDIKTQPATIFLNEIKRHSNLEKTSLENKNRRSFCVIS
jgi:hypothetical protein